MGKAEMCIKMLMILNSGRTYKKDELAYMLNTNVRNINEYRKEINEAYSKDVTAGYYIEKSSGPNGGYRISGKALLPSVALTTPEKESLFEALNYLMSRNDFLGKREYVMASAKIISSIVLDDIKNDKDLLVVNRYPLSVSYEEIEQRFKTIKQAIKEKKTITFLYLSQKNVEKERSFDPYEMFMYNNAWFVIGFLHSSNPDVVYFKLNRMSDIRITDRKFTILSIYKRSEYVDEYGFKANGDWYHVVFVAHGVYASLCKERIYGKNQLVEALNNDATKVSVDMQNKENIKVFALGFGEKIDIIEPEWLKEELKETALLIAKKY